GTTLTFSGSPDLGVTFQWAYSETPGGPYTDLGTGLQLETGALATTTYYVVTSTCTLTDDSNTSPEFMLEVRPTPSASASNDSPACLDDEVQLTGTTDIGTTFDWSGPQSFTSSDQNPTVLINSPANGGSYTFVATLNGCSSAPANTTIAVNEPI